MDEKKTLWIIPLIGLIAAALILYVDSKHVTDSEIQRDFGSQNDSLRNERKFIPVEAVQLRDLVVGAKTTNDLFGLDGPYLEEDGGWKAFIDVNGVTPYGLDKLLGDPKSPEWEFCYNDENHLHFDAEIKSNGDTVVYCPAYILAKLVEISEQKTQINR